MILQGTAQDGSIIPVQVDAQGRLVAEGLEGPAGPQGPIGPAGPAGPAGPEWMQQVKGTTTYRKYESPVFPSVPTCWEFFAKVGSGVTRLSLTHEMQGSPLAVSSIRINGFTHTGPSLNQYEVTNGLLLAPDTWSDFVIRVHAQAVSTNSWIIQGDLHAVNKSCSWSGSYSVGAWNKLVFTGGNNVDTIRWDYCFGYHL